MPTQETQLPITIWTWLAAFSPVLILLVLLVWRRWSTSAAAPVALAAAVLTAVFLLQTPAQTLAVAAGKSVWDTIFIVYVIWPALILYNIAHEAGAFEVMQQGIRRLMPDRLLVVLTFAWVLTSFIQSIAGFGTPLAVTVPLLIGLGVQPVFAVALPMIGGAWANMFGTLGVTWFATQTVVDLENVALTIRLTATLLWIPELMAGLAIAWMYGRWWALKRAGPAIAVVSLLHGGLQLLLVPILPAIGTFLASTAALAAVIGLNRWGFYRQHDEDEPNRIFKEGVTADDDEGEDTEPKMPLLLAFAPYAALAVLAIVVLVIPPIRDFLEQVEVGLPFPATTTGYEVNREAAPAYASFTPLTHPGTLLLISAAVGYILYRRRGDYPEGIDLRGLLARSAYDALPSTTAILALLLISRIMDHSGQITILALGITAIAPTVVYVAVSNFIGILGALITSSNTASNLLFAPLQATAARAESISAELMVAAQSAGGATGNALAPSDALMGATVAGISGQLGKVLQRALIWTLITGVFIAAGTLALHFLVTGGGG